MTDGAGILKRITTERDRICEIAAQNIRIFGSVARGEAKEESDLDLLIDLEPDRSLLDIVALESVLETLLGDLHRCCRTPDPALVYQGSSDGRGGAAVKDATLYLLHIRECIDRGIPAEGMRHLFRRYDHGRKTHSTSR